MTTPILPHLPPILTIPETSKELRCSDPTTYQLIRDGKLRAISFATSKRKKSSRQNLRVLAEDLREFVAAHRGNGR